MRVLRCAALVLVLGLVAGALPSTATGSPRPEAESHAAAEPARLVDRLWGLLANLWSEAGCILDPLGGCRTEAANIKPVPVSEEGCIIDPLGGCKPRP